MKRYAFRMKLIRGFEEEYKKRHDEIWPELVQLLKATGIEDYSIFFDEPTSILFAVYKCSNKTTVDELTMNSLMKDWWFYMKDIMETNLDHSPVAIDMQELFYLP